MHLVGFLCSHSSIEDVVKLLQLFQALGSRKQPIDFCVGDEIFRFEGTLEQLRINGYDADEWWRRHNAGVDHQ